jgi:hypothetical protein
VKSTNFFGDKQQPQRGHQHDYTDDGRTFSFCDPQKKCD